MDGILLIDKPLTWTSFDVVNKVRRLIESSGVNTSTRKRFPVGHTGTLDPLATGLLVLLLGSYTKRAPELTKLDKSYEVAACLGISSTTGDEEGEKQKVSGLQPSHDVIDSILKSFLGKSMQIPPAYSAIKINGKRAYEIARKGNDPGLKPRSVEVKSINLLGYEYPEVRFEIAVSSGTYIRSLVEDLGKKLSTGAYTSSLRRLKVGRFDISEALTIDKMTIDTIHQSLIE